MARAVHILQDHKSTEVVRLVETLDKFADEFTRVGERKGVCTNYKTCMLPVGACEECLALALIACACTRPCVRKQFKHCKNLAAVLDLFATRPVRVPQRGASVAPPSALQLNELRWRLKE